MMPLIILKAMQAYPMHLAEYAGTITECNPENAKYSKKDISLLK